MSENPFEQSTLQAKPASSVSSMSTSTFSGDGVEVRYGAAQRTVVPAVLAGSAIIAPLIIFFVLQPPLNFVMAAVVALMEFSVAGFMWFLFNSALVRADSSGVSTAQLGNTKSARWEEIATFELQQTSNNPTQIILKNASGNEVLRLSDLGNKTDGARLIKYIENKLVNT